VKSIARVSDVYDLPYIADLARGVGGYVDLRRDPKLISTIVELKDQPTLKSLVEALNHKDGIFMTHGCAFAHRRPEGHGVIIPVSEESASAQHWCSSYVAFSFWRFSQNTEKEYEALCEKYSPEGNGSEICFVIEPAYFRSRFEELCGRKWGERNGIVCLLWVSGWGESTKIAESRWRNAIKNLIQFLSTYKEVHGQKESGGMTISDQMQSLDHDPPAWAELD
jgi:hypothetical protein